MAQCRRSLLTVRSLPVPQNTVPYVPISSHFFAADSFNARLDLWTSFLSQLFPGSVDAFLENLDMEVGEEIGPEMHPADYARLVEGCVDSPADEDLRR